MKPRIVHLELWTIRFPITAIASIFHRISGILLFLLFPFFLWLVGLSLESPMHFISFYENLEHTWVKALLWLFCASFAYHTLAGVRHLLMDAHIGDSRCAGRLTAWLVLLGGAIAAILWGVFFLW